MIDVTLPDTGEVLQHHDEEEGEIVRGATPQRRHTAGTATLTHTNYVISRVRLWEHTSGNAQIHQPRATSLFCILSQASGTHISCRTRRDHRTSHRHTLVVARGAI